MKWRNERRKYISKREREIKTYIRLFNPIELFTIHDWPTLAYWNSFQIECHRLYTKQCHTCHELFFFFLHSFRFLCVCVCVVLVLLLLHCCDYHFSYIVYAHGHDTVVAWCVNGGHSIYLFRIEHPSQITEVMGIQMMIEITCFKTFNTFE